MREYHIAPDDAHLPLSKMQYTLHIKKKERKMADMSGHG